MHVGGFRRNFQVGFVSQEKGGNSSDGGGSGSEVEDKFKDDKFKDDPDVRGILSDIKGHFDQQERGPNDQPPHEDGASNAGDSIVDNTKKESDAKNEQGSLGSGGAKNMKELLEKIYGARAKAAAETSVGNDLSFGASITKVITRRLYRVSGC